MPFVGEVDEVDVLNPQDLEELYTWIDAVPFSRPKRNIARDFSDGVSVAEIIQFYLPRTVEIHNYVNANSTSQKRVNWSMLNRKVFFKLNLKLNAKLVENVIDARPGAIEQILWDVRKKISEMNPKSLSRSNTGTGSQLKVRASYIDLGGKKAPVAAIGSARTPSLPPTTRQGRLPSRGSATSRGSSSYQTPTPRISPGPTRATETAKKFADCISYSAGLQDELNKFGNNASFRPEPDSSSGANTGFFPGVVDANGNPQDAATLPPAHLIYKGHKMVPSMLLDMKNKQIRDLEVIVGTLQKKTTFLDNLIQLKDNRVEDLTRKLHSLRTKYQDLTQTKLPDY